MQRSARRIGQWWPFSSDLAQDLSKSAWLATALGNFGDLAQTQQFIRIKIDRFVGNNATAIYSSPLRLARLTQASHFVFLLINRVTLGSGRVLQIRFYSVSG